MRVSLAMLWSWGARPQYCSGSSLRSAPGRGLCVAPARWCGLARRPRPLREQAAGGGRAHGVRVQLRPPLPPRVAVPSGGGGASPRLRGGRGPGGERVRWADPLLPASLPCRVSACHPLSPARPPGVYSCCGGCRAAVGVRRGPVGRQWVSAAGGGGGGGGGGDLLVLVRAAASSRPASESAAPFAPSWAPPFRCRSVAGNAGVCGRSTGGAWRAAALAAAPFPPPPPGCSGLPEGVRGCCLSGQPLSALGPRRGGGGEAPRSPDAAPRRPRGPGLAVPAPGGQLSAQRADPSPAPLYPVSAGPSCRPSLAFPAPPAVVARRWMVWGGGGEGWWVLGAAVRVSGQRLVGCGAVGPPSCSLSPPSRPQEVARAPPSRCTVGGALVGGPGSAGGGAPRHCHPLTLSSPSSGPSPASPLVWGLGLWRWRISPAVAPVGEGVAQGPGEPVVGVCIRDAKHRPPLQEWLATSTPCQATLP